MEVPAMDDEDETPEVVAARIRRERLAAALSKPNTDQLRRSFAAFDLNSDGELDLSEVKKLLRAGKPSMKDNEIETIFKKVDKWLGDIYQTHDVFGLLFFLEGSLWRDVAIRKFEKEKHVLLEPPKWLKMAGKPSSLFCSEPGSQLSKFVELIDFHGWKNPLAFVLEILCHIICPQIIFSWTVQSLVFPTCILSSTKIGAEESQQSDQFQWTCLLGLFWKSQRFWESSLPQKSLNIAIQTRCGSVGVFSQLLRNSLVT